MLWLGVALFAVGAIVTLALAAALGRARSAIRILRGDQLASANRLVEVEAAHTERMNTLESAFTTRITELQQANHELRRSQSQTEGLGKLIIGLRERSEGIQRLAKQNRDGIEDVKHRIRTNTQKIDSSKAVLRELREVSQRRGPVLRDIRIATQRTRELHHRASAPDGQSESSELELPEERPQLKRLEEAQNALQRLDDAYLRISDLPQNPAKADIVDLRTLLPFENYPSVTVVVTCYNHERYIDDCLNSVASQSLTEFECIVVDDCSTDGSLTIAQDWAARDQRFKVLQTNSNSGPSAARNTGLAAARAPFVAFLDSDDLLLRQSLEQRLYTFVPLTDPSVAGVHSGIEPRSADVQFSDLPEFLPWQGKTKDFLSSATECPFNLHAVMMRTDVLRSFRGFDESMRLGAEDWELWYRILRNGFRFEPVHAALGIYRQEHGSLVRSQPADHLDASLAIIQRASAPALESDLVPLAPVHLERPHAHYVHTMDLANRALQYLGLALVHDDPDQTTRALANVPVEELDFIRGQFPLRGPIRSGIFRALGVDRDVRLAVRPEVEQLAERAEECLWARHQASVTTQEQIRFPLQESDSQPISLYYWQASEGVAGAHNFGDELSPLLVGLASGRKVERAELESSSLTALGSILEATTTLNQRIAVWGSGFIREGKTQVSNLDVSAVRGHLTRSRCGNRGVVGDPALLAAHLGVEPVGEWKIGVLPHYVDKELAFVYDFSRLDGAIVIDPQQPPLDVLAQIASCNALFSSSLHGLICADSLGIPNAWIELSENVVGAGYKFRDYYSCFDIVAKPLRPNEATELPQLVNDVIATHSRPGLDALSEALLKSFPKHV